MESPGTKTRREILSQPEAWAATLDVISGQSAGLRECWGQRAFDSVVLTGCGSTYYVALSAASILEQLTGVVCRGVPASELLLYPESVYPVSGRTLLIVISRSGETTETVNAARAFVRDGRGTLLTYSCYPDQPIATMGDINVVLPDAQEESVVQTRAFTSLLVAAVATAATWAERDDLLRQLDRLPAIGRRVIDASLDRVIALAEPTSFERGYVLGSGPQYGLACEASLKLKEMSLTPSEPFHFLELRHGPKSIIGPSTLVAGFHSHKHQAVEHDVMLEARSLGGKTLSLGASNADITIGTELDEVVTGALYLPPIQWLATERALRQGIDPDRPKNLDTVVKLNMAE